MQVIGIHHVALNVDDVDAAVRFYTEVLGGSVRSDRPDLGLAGAWIDLGAHQVHLLAAPVPHNLGQHVALRVDDLDGAVTELRARGLAVGDPLPTGSGRQTFVDDPSGNCVELHEPGAHSTSP